MYTGCMQPNGVTDLTKLRAEAQTPNIQPIAPKKPLLPRILRVLTSLSLLVILGLSFWQRQNILDWWQLRDYTPTVSASELATSTTMTDLGRRIFYLQKPLLQDKPSFYKSCEEGETAIVLGCYKPNGGIFLLDVQDDRLNGVEEVTAAHEMLHAAYGRLSYNEQRKIDDLVLMAYQGVDDQDITDKIDQYKKSNADIANELHSILPTEVSDLPAELDTYYQRYFTDRQKIVSYSVSYKSEFKTRKEKVDTLDRDLKEIESQIVDNNKKLDVMQSDIISASKELDVLLQTKDYTAYNTGVVAYNKSLIPFRSLYSETKDLVTKYKSILTKRNKLAEEAQELNRALDSNQIDVKVEDI